MAVETTVTSAYSVGNGVTTAFSLPFYFIDPAHIVVTLDGVVQGGGYSVAGARVPAGGSVTFTSPPGAGVIVGRRRVVPVTQPIDTQNNQTIFEDVFDDGLDRRCMVEQQITEKLGRAITAPEGEESLNMVLSAAALRAGGVLVFDDLGQPTPSDFTAAQLEAAIQAAAAGVAPGTLGALATTAALLSLFGSGITLVSGTSFLTIGRTVVTDGGGGVWYYDASDTTSADNGGTLRVDAQSRRWKLGAGLTANVFMFGAKGDNGVTDNYAVLVKAFAIGTKIKMGAGIFGVSANAPVVVNTVIEGIPGSTFIKNLNNAVAGLGLKGNNTVSGVGWKGFGSKNTGLPGGDYLDSGLIAGDAGGITLRDLTFDNMAGPCIYGVDVSNIDISNIHITNSCGGTKLIYDAGMQQLTQFGAMGDIYFTSSGPFFSNIKIRHVWGECQTTAGSIVAKDICVEVDSGPGIDISGPYPRFEDVIVEDVTAYGYERCGITVSSEYGLEGEIAGGKFVVRDCHVFNTGSIGIKIKANNRIDITDNYVENYEIVGPETTVIGGGIHCNNAGNFLVKGNQVFQPLNPDGTSAGGAYSTNAINIIGLAGASGPYSAPFNTSNMVMTNNLAVGSRASAFRAHAQSRNLVMADNVALSCRGHTLVAGSGTGGLDNNPAHITISNCTYRGLAEGALSNLQSFSFNGTQNISVSNCQSEGAGGHSMVFANATNVNVSNCAMYNSGTFGQAGQNVGFVVQETDGFTMTGCTSKNFNGYTDQAYGLSFGVSVTGPITVVGNGELSGFNGALFGGAANIPSSGVTIADNQGIWQGLTSWTPGAIGTIASVSKTLSAPGVRAGDIAEVGVPGTGNYNIFEAVCSADTLTLYYFNPTAATRTPDPGTFYWSVKRRT